SVVRGLFRPVEGLCRLVQPGAGYLLDGGEHLSWLRYTAAGPCDLQHPPRYPDSDAQAAPDGQKPSGRGPRPGLHLDAGLLEGHYPGDQARHHLRRTDRLHHEHRRFHHQLLHRRFRRVHFGHDHLFHDEKAGQPGDQCHFHAALRRCAAAAHH
ncbi:DNA gyrase inhibitory protein, partial [Dysosmobacter welbionis]